MSETEQQIREREYEANLQKLQDLRPIDDEFMRCMFKNHYREKGLGHYQLRNTSGHEKACRSTFPLP